MREAVPVTSELQVTCSPKSNQAKVRSPLEMTGLLSASEF